MSVLCHCCLLHAVNHGRCLVLQVVMLSLQTRYITAWHTFLFCFLRQVNILLNAHLGDRLQADRLLENLLQLLCAPPPLCLTFTIYLLLLCLATSLLSLAGPQSVWHGPHCKVPFSPSITIIGSDFLHSGSTSPEDLLEFHTAMQSHTPTHTHTETRCSFRHTITTWTKCCSARNRQVDISFLSFYLFISICPSIPWLFVSWAEISLLNNLVLLKRDHPRGTEGGEKETE